MRFVEQNLVPVRFPQVQGVSVDDKIKNADLRACLDKAVEDANLNVTERLALNKTFFPKGGGFNLFPEGKPVYDFNYYITPNNLLENDEFVAEAEELTFPEHVSRVKKHLFRT